jgi:hypothetical protein
MKRKILVAAGALLVVLVAIQLVPVDRSNPPVLADFDGPPEVEEGEMPLPIYLLTHPGARLTEAATSTLHDWSMALPQAAD